jgi:hypothetical protein
MSGVVFLSAWSGVTWGAVGYWLVRDTNLAGGASAGLMCSPAIGVLIGAMAVRRGHLGVARRGLLALAYLYVAVLLFTVAVSAWAVTVGWNALPSPLQAGGRARAFVDSVGAALFGFTASGYALVLWPASFANHMLIWARASGASRFQGLGLRRT